MILHFLHRDRSAHCCPVHQPALRQLVILDRPVLHRAIVPHQEVPGPPLMTVDESRLDDVIGERGNQGLGFRRLDALDPGAIVAHDIEAFAPGMGMRPDDRMGDRRIPVGFRLSGWKGPLAADKVEHRAAPVDALPKTLGQGIPGRRGAGEFGVAQRQTEQVGDFERVEHGPARRPCRVAHVAVPILAGAADADRVAVLVDPPPPGNTPPAQESELIPKEGWRRCCGGGGGGGGGKKSAGFGGRGG